MNIYKTAEIAQKVGVHPNTIRLYEELEFIPKPERQPNGYRMFTELHLEQLRLVRKALDVAVVQNGLRKKAVDIIKLSASGDLSGAKRLTKSYLEQIAEEKGKAEQAVDLVNQLLSGDQVKTDNLYLTRKQTADYLQLSIDTLRNWELNGLLTVKRKKNGYRVYTDEDIKWLIIIRALRSANYSLASILRMMGVLSRNPQANIKAVLNTPEDSEDIVSVCDKLLTSLDHAQKNARSILEILEEMNKLKTKALLRG